jgi:transcriptional regulator with XRE-family HTH domain
MEITKKQFGLKLKNARRSKLMTQEEVCKNVDYQLSLAAYSSYERGIKIPTVESLELVTDGLGLPFDYFYKDYIRLLNNKKLLHAFAKQLFDGGHLAYAYRCLGKMFYLAKKTNDRNALKAGIFRILMFRLRHHEQINNKERMIKYITNEVLSLKKQDFIQMLEEMYRLSYEQKEFDLFIEITKRVIGLLKYDPEKLFNLHLLYASALYYRKEYIRAYKVSEKALEYKESVDIKSLSLTLARHGNICLQLRFFEEALEKYVECIKLNGHDFSNTAVKGCYGNIARVYYKMGDYVTAKKYWENLLQQTRPDDLIRIHVLTDLTNAELQLGNIDQGKAYLQETKELLDVALKNDPAQYATEQLLYERNAAVLQSYKDPRKAVDMLVEITKKLLEHHLRDELINTFFKIGELVARYGIVLDEEQIAFLASLKVYFG